MIPATPHLGELDTVPDTELTQPDGLPTEENVSLAWNASRSFTVRKNRFTQDQEICLENEFSTIQATDTNLCSTDRTPKFTRETSTSAFAEGQTGRLRLSPLSELNMRKNKIKMSWKQENDEANVTDTGAVQINIEDKNDKGNMKTGNTLKPEILDEQINIFQDKSHGHHNSRKEKVKRFAESITFNVVVGIFTIFALLGNDIGTLIDSRSLDLALDIVGVVSFFVFAGEMVIALYTEPHYKCSLFFWLDLFSTLSITFHIEFLLEDLFPELIHKSAGIAEASRASRLATREGRIIQLIQIFQIGRLYKHVARNHVLSDIKHRREVLNKTFSSKFSLDSKRELEGRRHSQHSVGTIQKLKTIILDSFGRLPSIRKERPSIYLEDRSPRDEITRQAEKTAAMYRKRKRNKEEEEIGVTFKDIEEANVCELRIGEKLADFKMKKLVVLVLALLLLVPLFESWFYFHPPKSQDYEMNLLQVLIDDPKIGEEAKNKSITLFMETQLDHDPYLVYFKVGNDVLYIDPDFDINHQKHSQVESYTVTTQTRGDLVSIVSLHNDERLEAILGIIDTFFVCAVLITGAVLLNHDANKLILKPLEKIIQRVNKIVRDPASAREPDPTMNENSGFKTTACMIENAIVRMSRLLAIGFGEAGSAVVTQNFIMSGDLTPSFEGRKQAAIFGVIDIHDFIETTEVLQEQTLLFVNTIADIVHSMTDKYAGLVSQNMGDAFLLVWKFPEDCVTQNENGELEIIINQVSQNIADCALIAFMKIYARTNRDPTLLRYRRNPLLHERLPGYRVSMGFGLHVGWAIEGAIGSEHKIDAFYLSPDVNVTGKLEGATRHYDIPLLLSGDLHAMLSEKMKEETRLIDIVDIQGSDHPIHLFTVDMYSGNIGVAKDRSVISKEERRKRQKRKKDYLRDVIVNGHAYTLLHTDRDLKRLLRHKDKDFITYFNTGIENYVDGNWTVAKENFEACLEMKYDGPAKSLLEYMGKHDFVVPVVWERRHLALKK